MFSGIAKVYRFTLEQFLKGNANRVFLIGLFVFCLASLPVYTFLTQNRGTTSSDVTQLFELGAEHMMTEVPEETDGEDPSSEETGQNMNSILDEKKWEEEIAKSAHLTEQQVGLLFRQPETRVMTLSDFEDRGGAEEIDFDGRFAVQYVYGILVMILSLFSTTYIVRTMIEEKASRLIETLLLSVKPLALIFGKILAVMTYVVMVIVISGVGMFLSGKITPFITGKEAANPLGLFIGGQMDLMNIHTSTFLILIVSLLLGYLTFAMIGAIAGSSCAEMEDVEQANLAATWIVLIGYLGATVSSSFDGRSMGIVFSLIPIVSIFTAPVQYVLGNISLPILLLAWALQAVLIVILTFFCARVYKGLILYRGGRMKFRDLIKIAGSSGEGGKKA
ncbi:MAG: ABC transporter permease [Lachnospiraceae bacterium]|nr:ABC transporter permease [Lachnospiraceae bacterium]